MQGSEICRRGKNFLPLVEAPAAQLPSRKVSIECMPAGCRLQHMWQQQPPGVAVTVQLAIEGGPWSCWQAGHSPRICRPHSRFQSRSNSTGHHCRASRCTDHCAGTVWSCRGQESAGVVGSWCRPTAKLDGQRRVHAAGCCFTIHVATTDAWGSCYSAAGH